MARMDNCPAEVIHEIFKCLDFPAATALRLQGRLYANVGAEYLITCLRFHTSEKSLERLYNIATHPGLCKAVHTVIYEGNILAQHTREVYKGHFDADHPGPLSMPVEIGDNASPRALRLYERNLAKFENNITGHYRKYKEAFKKQQKVLASTQFLDATAFIRAFPKLKNVEFTTGARCGHTLSARFQEENEIACTMPMELSARRTVLQLRTMLIPNGNPLLGLQSLRLQTVSPRLFQKKHLQSSIVDVFKSLKNISLVFRMEDQGFGIEQECIDFDTSYLHAALAAARDVTRMQIQMEGMTHSNRSISFQQLLGKTVWPRMTHFDVNFSASTGAELVDGLRRQPSLTHFGLGHAMLSDDSWPDIIVELKKKLSLKSFMTYGWLDDSDCMWFPFYCDAGIYEEEKCEASMQLALDIFVTSNDFDGVSPDYNPLEDVDWRDPTDLHDEFGDPDSDDEMEYLDDMDEFSDPDEAPGHHMEGTSSDNTNTDAMDID